MFGKNRKPEQQVPTAPASGTDPGALQKRLDRIIAHSKAAEKKDAPPPPAVAPPQPAPANSQAAVFDQAFAAGVRSPLAEKIIGHVYKGRTLALKWALDAVDKDPSQLSAVETAVRTSLRDVMEDSARPMDRYENCAKILSVFEERHEAAENKKYSPRSPLDLLLERDPSPKRVQKIDTLRDTRERLYNAALGSLEDSMTKKMEIGIWLYDVSNAALMFDKAKPDLLTKMAQNGVGPLVPNNLTAIIKDLFSTDGFTGRWSYPSKFRDFLPVVMNAPDTSIRDAGAQVLRREVGLFAADLIAQQRPDDFQELVECVKPYPTLFDTVKDTMNKVLRPSAPKP